MIQANETTGPLWIGRRLFLGRTLIGKVEPANTPGHWLGFSFLPGAPALIGRDFPSETEAQGHVMQSAQSRCKAMFGAGMQTTSEAVNEGRKLRVVARAIWKAGVWRCDRPVNAHTMFEDLGRALGFKPEDAPRPNQNKDELSTSTAEAAPEKFDPIDSERLHA